VGKLLSFAIKVAQLLSSSDSSPSPIGSCVSSPPREYDPLLDDTVGFTRRLCGCTLHQVFLTIFPCMPHGFLNFYDASAECAEGVFFSLCSLRERERQRQRREKREENLLRKNDFL